LRCEAGGLPAGEAAGGGAGRTGRDPAAIEPAKRAVGDARTPRRAAAYNTACLYATLAAGNPALEKQVVTSLKRAINNPDSEMEKAGDWISHDPDFRLLNEDKENFPEFNIFPGIQRKRDCPLSRRPGRTPAP
jgi:hypothetical protein